MYYIFCFHTPDFKKKQTPGYIREPALFTGTIYRWIPLFFANKMFIQW